MTTSKPEKSHPNLLLSEIVFRSWTREPPVRSSCFGALQFSVFAVWALLSPEMDAKRILRLVKHRALLSSKALLGEDNATRRSETKASSDHRGWSGGQCSSIAGKWGRMSVWEYRYVRTPSSFRRGSWDTPFLSFSGSFRF